MSIREKYGIPDKAKILLYVGNISKNKNQEQMIEVFDLLPETERQNIYVLFLGRNLTPDYTLDERVAGKPYGDHLLLCGNVDRKYIRDYYEAADGVVLLSRAEGFGLSLIEGMHFGKPCMTFTDLEAFEDIYDACAVVGLTERTDDAVAKGVERLLNTAWDESEIKTFSKRFESAQMADNYLKSFNQIIG
jgi:glycosyltransferase involved in cell wall biosynthesis